jgi:hypothetical protein
MVPWAAVVVVMVVGCGRINFLRIGNTDPDAEAADSAATRWSLVQNAATTSGALAIASSGPGHLIVVAVHSANTGSVTSITDNGGNSYVAVPARATSPNPPDAVEIWYARDSIAGATTITLATTTSVVGAVAWETSGIRTDSPLDTTATLDAQAATTNPVGPSITTAEPGEFMISVAIVANGISGTHAGGEFTNDQRTQGNGWAHLTAPAAPAGEHHAEWDQGNAGTYCANAAAFRAGP